MIKGAVPGAEGSYVKVSDAVKKALHADAPKPGAFKKSGSEAAHKADATVETAEPAAEASSEGAE